ncbi:MAG: SPOR domain-containing protein [Gemmatimonadaceae bacterium]
MSRSPLRLFLAAVLVLGVVLPLHAQGNDPALARVRRLVNAGERATARALADSLVAAAPEGSDAFAEALYARAFASSSAADAERDYLRVSIEYPLAPQAEDAVMMVAQLKMARSDRDGARRFFERLVRDHAQSAQASKAAFWAGRLALEDGDTARGCGFLSRASERVSSSDVELRNQIDYYGRRCGPQFAAASGGGAVPSSGAPVATQPVPPATKPSTKPAPVPPAAPPIEKAAAPVTTPAARTVREDSIAATPSVPEKLFSVQVGAFSRQRDASALSDVLTGRGFEARVWGEKAPFRVRVGHYASGEAAAATIARLKASRVTGIVVEAEPR